MEPEVHKKPIRYYEIDLLRFLAALVVVLYHFTYRGFHANHASPVDYPALGTVFRWGYLGVELFFIISGYVVLLSTQGKTLGQFFASRVKRLYPAYLAGCTLTFVLMRLFGPAYHAPGWSSMLDAPLRGYLVNLTMLQKFFDVTDIDAVYWTLAYEIQFYFLMAVFLAFGWLRHLPLVLSGWLAYCALAGPLDHSSTFAVLLFPRYAPFFIGGMCLYLLQTKQAATWHVVVLLAGAYLLSLRTGVAVAAEMTGIFSQYFSPVVASGLLSGCFAILLLIALRKISLANAAWLSWLGALTYPIYLLHHNIGYVAFQRLGGHWNKYTLLLALLAGVGLLAYSVHTWVERPLGKRLGAILAKSLAKPA